MVHNLVAVAGIEPVLKGMNLQCSHHTPPAFDLAVFPAVILGHSPTITTLWGLRDTVVFRRYRLVRRNIGWSCLATSQECKGMLCTRNYASHLFLTPLAPFLEPAAPCSTENKLLDWILNLLFRKVNACLFASDANISRSSLISALLLLRRRATAWAIVFGVPSFAILTLGTKQAFRVLQSNRAM